MSFVNRSRELLDRVRRLPGEHTLSITTLWEHLANLNQGIAEILARNSSRRATDLLRRALEELRARPDQAQGGAGLHGVISEIEAALEEHSASLEQAARRLYEHHSFGTWLPGAKPAWTPGGNSTAQELARSLAAAALRVERGSGDPLP